METRYFTHAELEDLELLWNCCLPGENGHVVSKTHSGDSRWSRFYKVIFFFDGCYYEVQIERPSTESQEVDCPFGYIDPVPCPRVHEVERVVKVWEKVGVSQ